jgi:hypothetical protein
LIRKAGALVTLVALDHVVAEGSVVTDQIQALAGTLEVDRKLRLGSPPPSAEQLTYSTALIREQAERLQRPLQG